MKRLLNVMAIAVFLATLLLLPLTSAFAKTPEVPIVYTGDTDETIARRAKWVEGAKKEGKLVWWGSLRSSIIQPIIGNFKKVYPFISIEYWRGRTAEMATRVELQFSAKADNVDILLGGGPHNYPRWRQMGMLAKFADIIPGIEKIDKRMYSKYGDYFTPGNNAIVPMYNTNMVSADEAPKSWEDLLDSKWKGQISISPMMIAWYTLALGDGGWGIEKTESFLARLRKQDLIWARGHSAANTLMLAGEFKVVGEQFLWILFESKKKGAPTEWCRVSPVPVTGSSYILQRRAPHPNAARLFLEWLFSPQILITYEGITGKGAASPGTGTHLSKTLDGLQLVFRTEEVELKAVELGLVERFSKILGMAQ